MLRATAFWLLAVTSGFFMLFVVGETLDDPGGWAGGGLLALWLLPMAALVVLSVRVPDLALRALVAATAVIVAMDLVASALGGRWRDFEDEHGPVLAIATLAACLPLALVGRTRTMVAGVLLLAMGLAPVLASGRSGTALLVASSPPLLAGALYVASDLLRGDEGRSSTSHA